MRYWCDDANLGYDQNSRWNIAPGGECDCSSLVIWCLSEAGFDTGNTPRYGFWPTTGATYTGNMSSVLTARGWKRLPNDGHPKTGDILLNDAHHVAVYVGNGLISQASNGEHGATGNQTGDQTGRETITRGYYNYPWDCYLRWTGQEEPELTDAEMDKLASKVAAKVWAAVLDDKTARKRLIAASDALTDTSDPTGRNQRLTMTKHVKWIAKVLQDVNSKIDRLIGETE